MPQEAKSTEWSGINFMTEDSNVREGLYLYGLPFSGCLIVGRFRPDYNLGTITTEFYVSPSLYISLFRRSIHLISRTGAYGACVHVPLALRYVARGSTVFSARFIICTCVVSPTVCSRKLLVCWRKSTVNPTVCSRRLLVYSAHVYV